MAKKNKLKGLVDECNLDKWLCTSGYLLPRNESDLDNFELLYQDWDFKLKNTIINYDAIISGSIKLEGQIIEIQSTNSFEIDELKFAARKGEKTIPDWILKKMKNKHQNGDK